MLLAVVWVPRGSQPLGVLNATGYRFLFSFWLGRCGKMMERYFSSPILNWQSLLVIFGFFWDGLQPPIGCSPPARWGSLDFIRVTFSFLPPPSLLNGELQMSVGTARPQPRVPDLSGHCRTSTASSRPQWAWSGSAHARECQNRWQKECQNRCQRDPERTSA